MPQQQLIITIGRIERALSRLEQLSNSRANETRDPELVQKHERLKAETLLALGEIDEILAGGAR